MTITDVKIRKTFDNNNIKAHISITFDDCFAVHDVKIIEVDSKTFVSMPSRLDKSGVYRNIVHPINQEMRNYIEQTVMKAFEEHVANQQMAKVEETVEETTLEEE